MSEETGRQRKKTARARRLRVPLDEVPRQGVAKADAETRNTEAITVPVVDLHEDAQFEEPELDEPELDGPELEEAHVEEPDVEASSPIVPPPPRDALAAIAPESIAPSVRTPPPAPPPSSVPPPSASRSSAPPPGEASSVRVSRTVITGVPAPSPESRREVHAPVAAALPREERDTEESIDEVEVDAESTTPGSVEARSTDPDSEPAFGDEASTDISIEEVPIGDDDEDDDLDELASEPTIVRASRSDRPPPSEDVAPARAPSSPPRPLSQPPAAARPLSQPPAAARPLSQPPAAARPLSQPPRPLSQPPVARVPSRPPPSIAEDAFVETEPAVPASVPPEPDDTFEPDEELSASELPSADSTPSSAMLPPAAPPPPPPAAARAVPPAPPPAAARAKPPTPPADATAPVREPSGPYRDAPEQKKRKAWWETFFNDDYLRTVRPPRAAQVMRQCNFIEYVLGLQPGGTILDVACGLGMQAVELSTRGYLVVGVDLSLPMLSRAADEAQEANQKINFLHADMRELAFDGTFDAVMSLGTSFGYFDDETNRQVLERMKKALKPGGVLLLDTVNRDFVLQQQPNLVWFEGDGCVCMEETQFNYITSRLHVKRTVILDDGRQRENEYAIRLYTLNEIGQILHHMGFRVMEVSGNEATPGVYFGAFSSKLIILAEKRTDVPMTATASSSSHRSSPSQPDLPKQDPSPPKTPPPPPPPKDEG